MANGYSRSPKLLKGALIQFSAPMLIPIPNIIIFQYNPDILTRTLQPQAVKEGGDRSEALRLTGPPVETIRLDAEINTMKGHCP